MRRFAAALAVVVLGVAPGGCSLGIQGPAKHASLAETPKCDTGRAGVFADGVFGTGFGIGGLAGLGNDETGLGLASLVAGGLLIASAVHGHGQASACERAIVEHDQYVAGLQDGDGARDDVRRVAADRAAPADDSGPVPMLPTPAVAAKALVAGEKPVVAKPPAAPAPAPEPEPAAGPETDEWSAFWEAAP